MMQLIINIFVTASLYFLVAQSFSIIYYPSKFFHLAQAAIITLSAYFTYYFAVEVGLSLALSILLAIISTIAIGIFLAYFIIEPFRRKKNQSFVLLIVSLGLYVILQNLISLIWGDSPKSFRMGEVKVGHEVLGAYVTDIQAITIIVSASFFILSNIFLKTTKLGRNIRGVSSNEELTNIFGIDSNKVIIWSFIFGSFLASVSGVLVAFDTDMSPTMGFNLLLYGVIAMIIAGIESSWGLVGGSLLLASAQYLGAYIFESKWMDAIAYIILMIFLVCKPFGLSGGHLKKNEI
jgi:branched-chain amino acid transport system permease protein